MGATNPVDAAPGTIRGDLALEMSENLIHGSDSPESAAREIEHLLPRPGLNAGAPDRPPGAATWTGRRPGRSDGSDQAGSPSSAAEDSGGDLVPTARFP